MSLGENGAPSKLRPPTEIPKPSLVQKQLIKDGTLSNEYQKPRRPIGSIAARAQAWERCPTAGYVSIGSVRYGVRFSSNVALQDVAPPRGVVGKLPTDSDCCCGVVQLAWPRVGAPPSRIPLPPRSNNTVEAPVHRSSLEVSRPNFSGDGVMKGAPPTPTSLRRRILVKFGNASSAPDGETSRLIPAAESREDIPSASAANQMQSALDKLQKFRFGSASSSEDKSVKKKRSGEKTEKLRELTDLLRGRPERKKPPASPQGKPSKPGGLRSLFGSTTSLTGPAKEVSLSKGGHKRAASITSVPVNNSHAASAHKTASALTDEIQANTVQEEEAPKPDDVLPDVSSLRPFASRSASFSQVDYNSSNGKYSWKRGNHAKSDQTALKSLTFPRKSQVDASTSVSPPPEHVPEERTCSTPSVDSAVGSDEGLGLGSTGYLATAEINKGNGGRSLTHPLTSRRGIVSENIPYSSIDSNGLKSLQVSRELADVKEEIAGDVLSCGETSSSSQATIKAASNLSVPNIDSCDEDMEIRLSKISTSSAPGEIQSSHNQEMLLPLVNLGKEIDELLDQEKSNTPKRPEIFITTWPKSNECEEIGKLESGRKKLTLNCNFHQWGSADDDFVENQSGTREHKIDNNNGGDRNSSSPQRWSGGTDSSQSNKEYGSEPMSPDEIIPKPVWPKTKPKLVCQSSEEKDEDSRSVGHRYLVPRNDSLSGDDSDHGDRSPSTPRRDHDGDRTCSPSPLFYPHFDSSDTECRVGKRNVHHPRRYSKRPLRGPYGQMLEAEMKKPETRLSSKKKLSDELKFLEDYLPPHSASSDRPSSESRLSYQRPRTSTVRSLDDSHLRTCYGANPRSSPKRKVSANIPYSDPNPATNLDGTIICHQRTTSSPSQLAPYDTRTEPSPSPTTAKRQEPTQALLAELLKGSSERRFHHDDDQDHSHSSKFVKDERSHVVIELLETESFYVESLQIVVKKYLNPLKSTENEDLIDSALVDEIFYQIPEILKHHEYFLEELKKRLESWNSCQNIGDIILEVFTKQPVIETYMSYVSNCKKAKDAVKATCKQKPLFEKFLTNASRGHKGKLDLDSLIIMPVQRIPHYELLLQRLIKNTDLSHPDHELLLTAQREVHALAVKIDNTTTECFELEQQQRTLRDLESLIEGLADLSASERAFLRMDTVTMVTGQGARKDRALFLFSDLLVITSIKRRAGPMRKPIPSYSGLLAGTVDINKYKLLRRLTLDELDIVKTKDEKVRNILREVERLSEDSATLTHISELSGTLHTTHAALDESIRELLANVNRQLQERQTGEAQQACHEVNLSTQNEGENISVVFTSTEKRSSWEEAFNEAKQKLALSSEHRPCPEFVSPVPIRKTRAGLQFTCASPALGLNTSNLKDVWVCNSDGYVGQVCVLSLQPEPNVISCNGVCNARILCIASVPSNVLSDSESNRTSSSSDMKESGTGSLEDADDGGSELDMDSSSSSSSSEDEEGQEGEVEVRRSKSEPLSGEVSADDGDALQPAMWLGTEDGNIHVYNCSDNIRVKKNKVKIQHGSSVQCIVFHDNRVYVALANGDVTVYSRDRNGGWNTSEPESIAVGTAAASVSKMIPVGGRMWCGCHNMIRILNIASLEVEKSFPISPDCSRMVSGLAVANMGVWIALHNSAVLRLFHANTFECLIDVNVAPAVQKMLAGCDDIIRQHKAACLRVTSLLACKDLLWVGTSAGVVLTMPLPHVTASTSKLNNIPNVTGVPQGHTGHVRFLTSVEISPAFQEPPRPSRHRHSIKNKPDPPPPAKVLVISGGDGYEDFRNANASEVAGRDDSTNHLLLWQI